MTRRLGPLTLILPPLVILIQVGAAALALGRPDLGSAASFLAGAWPTAAATLAAVSLLIWAVVVGASSRALVQLGREVGRRAAGSRRMRNVMALGTGLLILVGGAVHHVAERTVMSGGSVQEAQSILGR